MSIDAGIFAVDKTNIKVPPAQRLKVSQNMRAKFKKTETATIKYWFGLANDMFLVENGAPVKEIHRTLEVSSTGTSVDETLTLQRGSGARRDTYHLKQLTVDEGDRETPQTVLMTIA